MGKKTRLENSQTESINSIERFPLAMAILNFLPITQFMTKDLYQVQETLKKLCGFSTVWADRADLGRTKTAEQKLKYATFEASFFMFSWAKNYLKFF